MFPLVAPDVGSSRPPEHPIAINTKTASQASNRLPMANPFVSLAEQTTHSVKNPERAFPLSDLL